MDDLAKISDLLNELQATADRRLELLKEIHSNIVYNDLTCPVCEDDGCSVDCRLVKELSDEDSEGGISNATLGG